MALGHQSKGAVKIFAGSFTGASTPVIGSGKGTFTVARSGSTTSTIYTITLRGPEPVGQKIVCVASVMDATLTGATDAFLLNVKEVTPGTGTIVLQARDVAGTVAAMDDAATVNFVAYVFEQSDVVA